MKGERIWHYAIRASAQPMTWLLRKYLAIQKSLVNLFAICWTYQQKNVTILEGSNIHVLSSLPYSAQDFYTSIDVLAELDNGTQVIIEIQVHHQNFFINRLWAYLCSQVNQNLEKIRQREGDTHQSYKHIAPVYAIAIVDSNYFSDDLAFHSF